MPVDTKGECCSFTTPHIVEYQRVNPFLRGVGKQGEISPGGRENCAPEFFHTFSGNQSAANAT